MHYHIYCNLKAMHPHHRDAILEFEKRLSAYCDVTLHTAVTLSFSKDIKEQNHLFLFVENGPSTYSSEEFSDFIKELQHSGKSNVHIMIGFSKSSLDRAGSALLKPIRPISLSLTRSDLSTQTQTLLFYEQLYRAYTILHGKTYHK